MRSIAVILVSLLSLSPLYSFALPTNNAVHDDHPSPQHHSGSVTDMKMCSPTLHEKKYALSGIDCVNMGGTGFQPFNTKGGHVMDRICMGNEQVNGFKSPGICWIPKDSNSGATKSAALGQVHSTVNMVKARRNYVVRRAPVDQSIAPPVPIRPLPPIPAQKPAANAQQVPRPLPRIPGSHPQGPRPKPRPGRY